MTKIVITFVLFVLFAAAILAVHSTGKSVRVFEGCSTFSGDRIPLHSFRKTTDVYSLWKQKQLKGRIVVHLGKYLHFVEPDSPAGYRVSASYPLKIEKLPDPEDRTDYRNFLWSAMQSNFVREIYYVIPAPDFRKRFNMRDATGIEHEIVDQTYGSRRTVTTRLPSVTEPVLLNIDASFFASTDSAAAVRALKKSGLSVDLVTVCLAEDNPDVTPLERERAREFASLLSSGAQAPINGTLVAAGQKR